MCDYIVVRIYCDEKIKNFSKSETILSAVKKNVLEQDQRSHKLTQREKKVTTRNYKSFLRFVLNQSDQIFADFKLEILGLLRY